MASIGIYILCGGASSRMGRCKTQVRYHNEPLLNHILCTCDQTIHPTHLVCKAHQIDQLQTHDRVFILDQSDIFHPLNGIVTALQHAQHQFDSILILPCDTPHISVETVHHLLQRTPSVATDITGRLHPMWLHIPTSWLNQAETHLQNQGSMRDFAGAAHRVTVPIHETLNINQPDDLSPN